jgi:sugar O-acyltransferase (sialic acid O-acetyltransferase NeuD family)
MEAAALAGMRIDGFLDDNPAAPVSAILIDLPHPFPSPRHLGNLEEVHRTHGRHWIVAIGDVTVRRKLLRLLLAAPDLAPMPRSVVHPTAFVSPSAVVGPGTYIGPRAVVHARARIGAHCIINSGAVIEHDCAVGENTHIAPGAVLGGSAKVGHDALIGLGCRILPGLSVGHRATVGAGAVVTKPVADHTTVTGVPAQVS